MAITLILVDTGDDGERIHVTRTVAASGDHISCGDTLHLSQFRIIATTQAAT